MCDYFNRLINEVCSGSNPSTSPVENLYTAQAGGNEALLGGAGEVGAMPGTALPLTISAYTAGYTYDPAGNRLTKTDSRPGQGTFSYGYDEENRLTLEAADHPDPTPDEQIDFGYDKNGNMTRQTVKEWNGAAFVQVREDTYAYDYADRLNVFTRTALPSPTTFTYGYAPTGDRVTKTQTGGNTQTFIYDGRDVIADYSAPPLGQTGFVKAYLGTLGIDSKICEISSAGSPTYYNVDILGSVHQLLTQPQVGQQPEVIAGSTQLTTAWGEPIMTGGGMTRYGFTQRERDDESDLQYSRARHYSAGSGRFVQKEPMRGVASGEMQFYAYAANNPLRYTDPTGKTAWDWIITGEYHPSPQMRADAERALKEYGGMGGALAGGLHQAVEAGSTLADAAMVAAATYEQNVAALLTFGQVGRFGGVDAEDVKDFALSSYYEDVSGAIIRDEWGVGAQAETGAVVLWRSNLVTGGATALYEAATAEDAYEFGDRAAAFALVVSPAAGAKGLVPAKGVPWFQFGRGADVSGVESEATGALPRLAAETQKAMGLNPDVWAEATKPPPLLLARSGSLYGRFYADFLTLFRSRFNAWEYEALTQIKPGEGTLPVDLYLTLRPVRGAVGKALQNPGLGKGGAWQMFQQIPRGEKGSLTRIWRIRLPRPPPKGTLPP